MPPVATVRVDKRSSSAVQNSGNVTESITLTLVLCSPILCPNARLASAAAMSAGKNAQIITYDFQMEQSCHVCFSNVAPLLLLIELLSPDNWSCISHVKIQNVVVRSNPSTTILTSRQSRSRRRQTPARPSACGPWLCTSTISSRWASHPRSVWVPTWTANY